MKRFIVENKSLVILWVLCGIALFTFCGHYGNILLDVGREIYYPEQILNGKVLYKDLFNIYGPFSYLWNALLYKIFTPNLGTLYFSGILCSYAIVTGIYLIARKFLSEFLSLSLCIFTIVCGVCAPHLFNYTMPYSYGMLYGTVGAIYSLLMLLKFKEENKTHYLYLSALLAGLCAVNKYDFLLYGLFLFAVALTTKSKKIILNFITCFMFIPIICGLILFLQHLNMTDCLKAYHEVKSIIASHSIEYFYSIQGIFFKPKIILLWIVNFLKTGLCFIAILGGVKILDINKIFGLVIIAIASIILYFIASPTVFMFLTPLTIITALVCIKNIKNNPTLICLIIGTLTLCMKCFWALLTLNYGNYTAPLLICTFLAVLFSTADKKYQKAFAIGLLVVATYYLVDFSIKRIALNYKVSTNKGSIYTYEKNAQTTNEVISGLTASNAKSALIYPEGLIINFLAGVKSNDYYNSLIPLYAESIGEQKFVDLLDNMKPDFVILTNQNMKEYGSEYICDNYAIGFCQELEEKYTILDDINDGFRYLILGRNLK